ncbi:hypothetical protein CYMTET_49053 [Cymbomonas tetramitiformis]|uniref:Uncharacterized protein n=1 Tax=Cymbomonas tetramitiformis TaxID=36881 RepID=A0AAE0EUX8_9CHLO|nr:hypothetical protein CYMTET_49053 [Cymbomonas tetramitiformis]
MTRVADYAKREAFLKRQAAQRQHIMTRVADYAKREAFLKRRAAQRQHIMTRVADYAKREAFLKRRSGAAAHWRRVWRTMRSVRHSSRGERAASTHDGGFGPRQREAGGVRHPGHAYAISPRQSWYSEPKQFTHTTLKPGTCAVLGVALRCYACSLPWRGVMLGPLEGCFQMGPPSVALIERLRVHRLLWSGSRT